MVPCIMVNNIRLKVVFSKTQSDVEPVRDWLRNLTRDEKKNYWRGY